MGAAISIFVLMSLSIFIIRIAAVAMGLKLMAVRNHDGNIHTTDGGPIDPDVGGWLIAYGDDKAHDALAERS